MTDNQVRETTTESQAESPAQILSAVKRPSLVGEFWLFIKNEKKWWLTPIVIVMLLLTFLIVVGQTPLGPFIYPLF